MGRAPCCDKANVKKGPWSPEEDLKLKAYIEKNGTGGNWISFPQRAGLKRCGKSCRLRWLNYLRPNIKHGKFSDEEDRIICTLFATIGSRWSIIAAQLPGRTDNDIKNYWNTKLKKKLMISMLPPHTPSTHQKIKPPTSTESHYQTSSSLAPLYKDFTSFMNHTSSPSNISSDLWKYPFTNSSSSPSSLFQFQDGGSMMSSPMNRYCYPSCRKENMLLFGSSEASYNGTKDIKQEDLATWQSPPTGFEENNINGSGQNVNQLQYYWTDKATTGFYGESASIPVLDYDVEDFKKQLTSSSCTSDINSKNNSFNLIEENKTAVEKKTMYYNYYY
ncbi:hypothetical protein HS088_TW22G01163 [Tripterygium wilfordii]|uniref:Transcription factor RAX2-like n=1 Tax=Tripterygium wilfordii TaxID=458696 RepID=A0A7J7BZY6_TRIWF|nr:transcription factor RAX2-like [Tripterygium wilfordii]KAF5727470.1 hypothetical protein HS088_TW22G01163 [Tripterygium wilfordii]